MHRASEPDDSQPSTGHYASELDEMATPSGTAERHVTINPDSDCSIPTNSTISNHLDMGLTGVGPWLLATVWVEVTEPSGTALRFSLALKLARLRSSRDPLTAV
ncbi:hypothetical protein N7510_000572 [Penicillium lagena]|uniref:uncharacterized protein n=1 Tax=Penicillium lagena TaxID=94218 RepID=UPI0025420C2D|nr:uncharacterized protein N7510_000572 [Penicillium lagena]KAJ5624263.1 hypothetical protein N7510_000572 [Penicillium lagena]